MADVLIWDSTERSPELRHEVPIGIRDPFLYAERDGVRHVVIGSMEIPRLAELDGLELHPPEEFGFDELIASGMTARGALLEIAARACAALGVDERGRAARRSRSSSPTACARRASS